MEVRLVIFDLDGVVVNTDEFHFMAWEQVLLNKWGICHTRGAEDLTKGIPRYTCMELLAKHYHIAATPQELHRTADEKKHSLSRIVANHTFPATNYAWDHGNPPTSSGAQYTYSTGIF